MTACSRILLLISYFLFCSIVHASEDINNQLMIRSVQFTEAAIDLDSTPISKEQYNKVAQDFSYTSQILDSEVLGENRARLIIDIPNTKYQDDFLTSEWNDIAVRISHLVIEQKHTMRILLEGDKKQLEKLQVSLDAGNNMCTISILSLDTEAILKGEIVHSSPNKPKSKETIYLSLEKTLRNAIVNNVDVLIQKDSVQIQNLDYDISKGIFAPTINFSTYYRNAKTPVIDAFNNDQPSTTIEELYDLNSSISGQLPIGGSRYELKFQGGRTRTNSPFRQINPAYNTSLEMKLEQPLLKDFWIDQGRYNIKLKKVNANISEHELIKKLQDIVFRTESAYWDLYVKQEEVKIAQEAVDLAIEQLKRTHQGTELGINPKIDKISSEAALEKRKEELIVAQNTNFRAQNSLKALITSSIDSPLWKSELVIKDKLNTEVSLLDFQEALELAYKHRPEFKILSKRNGIETLNKKYLINQGFPKLNLVNSYAIRGTSGAPTGSVAIIDRFKGDLLQSLDNLSSTDFATVRVGVDMSWPVAPHITKKKLTQIDLRFAQLQKDYNQLEQSVHIELLNAFNSMDVGKTRIRSARAALTNASEQLQVEQERFNLGMSSNFLVLTRQNDLSNARKRLVQAIVDYNTSIAQLEKASGVNLKYNNVLLIDDQLIEYEH